MGDVLRSLVASHPDGIGFLVLMRAEEPIPSAEVRAEAAAHFKWMGARCKFQAVIREKPGVVVSLLRATLRTFSILSGAQKVFLATSIREAADLTVPILGAGADSRGFVAAIDEILERHAQRLVGSRESPFAIA